jgi:hypothetical protein
VDTRSVKGKSNPRKPPLSKEGINPESLEKRPKAAQTSATWRTADPAGHQLSLAVLSMVSPPLSKQYTSQHVNIKYSKIRIDQRRNANCRPTSPSQKWSLLALSNMITESRCFSVQLDGERRILFKNQGLLSQNC